MTIAAGYTRLSQDSDTSIERQKRHIREYADENGFEISTIYDDGEHSSGFDTGRAAYQQLRSQITSGNVDAVIVNDKRRLARDVDEVMRLIPDLRTADVELHTYQDGHLDLSDPMRAAIEILMAAAAHEEKLEEIRKAIEAVEERMENGYAHGQPPIGLRYDTSKKHLEQDPGEWSLIVETFEKRADGDSFSTIADDLGLAGKAVAHRIVNRRERYQKYSDRALPEV